MSISRVVAGFVYFCYRAKCGKKGLISESPIPGRHIPKQKKAFTPKYLHTPLTYIPKGVYIEMLGKYGVSSNSMHYQEFSWDEEAKRLYMPVRNHMEYVIGGVAKTSQIGRKPKVIAYRHTDKPFIHFPRGQCPSDTLILVEDVISATKIAGISYCAALLGTNLTEEVFSYLKKDVRIKEFVLLFDADAHKKMLQIRNKYKTRGNFRIILLSNLQRDPKDLNIEELKELLL